MSHGLQRIFLLAAAIAFLAPYPTLAQCPSQTSVVDTLFNADGSPAEGRVVIAWQTFQAGTCQVVAGQVSVTVTAGALSVPLYPNDSAIPAGTSYRVTYYLKSGRITTEYWVVPSSAVPVPLSSVRSPSVPVPAVMMSQGQVTNLVTDLAAKIELPGSCPAGKFLKANGSTSPPQVSCVDGTGAPLAGSTQSGTVKTDIDEADPVVYTKASSDTLLAGKASALHTHDAADTTSGLFDPSRLPAPTPTSLGGVQSGVCTGTDKVNGVSTTGVILCAADQAGAGGAGSQHQVNGINLTANDPVNFKNTSSIGVSNPSAGDVEMAVMADSTVQRVDVAKNSGATSGTRKRLNFIEGTNVTLNVADDAVNNEVDITIAAAGGTGAPLDASYLVAALDGTLTGERRLQGTTNRITLSDGGANGDLTIDVGSSVVLDTQTVTRDFPLRCDNPRVKSGAGNAFFDVEGMGAADVDLTVAKFLDAADGRITCTGFVPNELAATPAAKIIFDLQPHAGCATSQNFRVNIRYRFWGATTTDTALTSETAQDVVGSTTAHAVTRATFPASGSLANAPAVGDNVVVELQRNGGHANDTCPQTMEILPGSVRLRVDVKVKN